MSSHSLGICKSFKRDFIYKFCMLVSDDISFLACTKVIGPDSLYCGKWGRRLKVYIDLDLDLTMLNKQ